MNRLREIFIAVVDEKQTFLWFKLKFSMFPSFLCSQFYFKWEVFYSNFIHFQVQAGLRLPLTGLAPPRLLMCSASMGAEGSVTLQLREAVQAPISNESTGATATINNALTIGYPDPEILADVLGSFQAASGDTTYDITMSDGTTHRQLFKTTSGTTINAKSEGM